LSPPLSAAAIAMANRHATDFISFSVFLLLCCPLSDEFVLLHRIYDVRAGNQILNKDRAPPPRKLALTAGSVRFWLILRGCIFRFAAVG
jgi:hypothetical protein